jgi:hypothetical protein
VTKDKLIQLIWEFGNKCEDIKKDDGSFDEQAAIEAQGKFEIIKSTIYLMESNNIEKIKNYLRFKANILIAKATSGDEFNEHLKGKADLLHEVVQKIDSGEFDSEKKEYDNLFFIIKKLEAGEFDDPQ